MPPSRTASLLAFSLLALAALASSLPASFAAGPACSVTSGPTVPAVVELYTSEGCDSCPPADQWLSGLKGRSDVIASAFHVDYWDYIGWKDRFASPAYTQRQRTVQTLSGARFIYTPQIVLDGRDWTGWRSGSSAVLPARRPAALAQVELQRTETQAYTATVTPLPGAPQPLAAYWVVTENGHVSDVKAGENKGVMLKHDFVVRQYEAIAEFTGTQRLTWRTLAANPQHPRQISPKFLEAPSEFDLA